MRPVRHLERNRLAARAEDPRRKVPEAFPLNRCGVYFV